MLDKACYHRSKHFSAYMFVRMDHGVLRGVVCPPYWQWVSVKQALTCKYALFQRLYCFYELESSTHAPRLKKNWYGDLYLENTIYRELCFIKDSFPLGRNFPWAPIGGQQHPWTLNMGFPSFRKTDIGWGAGARLLRSCNSPTPTPRSPSFGVFHSFRAPDQLSPFSFIFLVMSLFFIT